MDSKIPLYYEKINIRLILGDAFEVLQNLPSNSFDMVFADPPYFLSGGGITCHSGKMTTVDKGDWDKSLSLAEKHKFNVEWIALIKERLTLNGTIWVSGTLHNIYSIGMALEENGFKILNNITWQKTNPPPNLGCRCFTHSTETLLWAKKDNKKAKHVFHYDVMKELNDGKQMKDVWTGSLTSKKEKAEGKHPTQKPLYLLEKIILSSTNEGDWILDPFCGSSTTGVAAQKLNRNFVGIDNNKEYLDLSIKRLEREI